jgi:thiol-disulfide isomerase/thioredoxin
MNYLSNVIVQHPDSIIKETDMLLERVRHDSSLFRYMLITLFNHYGKSNIMGMDAVQVHLAEQYYINNAWWSSDKFIADLKERIAALKPLLIGSKAPNAQLRVLPADHFILAEKDTAVKKFPHAGWFVHVHDIEAKYLVLAFWEANCSHCKKIIPQLYRLYNDTLSELSVEVLAISTLFNVEGKVQWIDFVNKYELYNWMNAWNPYSAEYKSTYDIRSTPQLFLLDDEKNILAKRIGPKQIVELVNELEKAEKKKP